MLLLLIRYQGRNFFCLEAKFPSITRVHAMSILRIKQGKDTAQRQNSAGTAPGSLLESVFLATGCNMTSQPYSTCVLAIAGSTETSLL